MKIRLQKIRYCMREHLARTKFMQMRGIYVLYEARILSFPFISEMMQRCIASEGLVLSVFLRFLRSFLRTQQRFWAFFFSDLSLWAWLPSGISGVERHSRRHSPIVCRSDAVSLNLLPTTSS